VDRVRGPVPETSGSRGPPDPQIWDLAPSRQGSPAPGEGLGDLRGPGSRARRPGEGLM